MESEWGQFDTAAVHFSGLVFAVFVLIAMAAAFGSSPTSKLGSDLRPRRRKLDRSQRSFDARLGSSNTLATHSPERMPSLF
jgi:hypothetical protein